MYELFFKQKIILKYGITRVGKDILIKKNYSEKEVSKLYFEIYALKQFMKYLLTREILKESKPRET